MRATQLLALSGLMLAGKVAVAAELDRDDVPNRCWDVCGPVVGTAHRCDGMHDRDRAEMDCICDWNQAPSLVPLCEACIADYRADRNNTNRDRHYDEEHDLFDDDDDDDDDDRDPHHNDAYDILRSCSFSTTSYNAAAATSALSNTASATGSSSRSGSTGSTTVSATDSSTSATSTNGGSGGSGSSNDDSNSADSAQTTDNAAPGSSAPQAASLAAIIGLGFVAML
ncbi:putative GPI anchored protein [Aspergillus melleus]|uniref:putative GPI anchored protein n=1 Tax=Aspergillus melleus TaxID=138277 RepID=UPI001E8DF02D|nr:uncharacterized protein LDX57_008465 [Aspergillus melleus]KAH8430803.1 hypothetical protein LDX57_008465 [Aspergillus melleus]